MKGRIITEDIITDFRRHLRKEEKSDNVTDILLSGRIAFKAFISEAEITKETVITFKQNLVNDGYAVRSVKSMLASLNILFLFSVGVI